MLVLDSQDKHTGTGYAPSPIQWLSFVPENPKSAYSKTCTLKGGRKARATRGTLNAMGTVT